MIRRRYRRIVWFFSRILLGFIFWDLVLPRIGGRERAIRTRPSRMRNSAVAFRRLAIEMGGVMIKVGQFLSTRVDVLPAEVTEELAGLQDEVPPEDFAALRQVAEAEFGVPLERKFIKIEEIPLAAASLGQVHQAQVLQRDESLVTPGRVLDVVVKIQRPNIENIIATDLAALQTVGKWLYRYKPIRKRADVPALLSEFARILYEEIDYLAEGRNAVTFATNFLSDKGVRVPYVVWTHTTKRVLTLENVWAIKITDYDQVTAAGIDRKDVATRLLNTYLKQIFEDGFFHADPHPGNLFIYPLPEMSLESDGRRKWQLTFVDFGMVGRVPPNTKSGLREMVIGVGTRDAGRVVKSYQMLDMLLPDADLDLLEKAEAKAFDRFWGKDMSELQRMDAHELREFSHEFRELIYEMPFQVPQDFIFLVRAVGILAGMCTGLDPKFNIWEHIVPYAEKLIIDEAKFNREIWLEEAKKLINSLLVLPVRLDKLFGKLQRGEIAVQTPQANQQLVRIEIATRRIVAGVIFAAFLLTGSQFYIAGFTVLSAIFFGGAGIALVWILLSARGH